MELSLSRSLSGGRDVLYASDPATGREVGRFDRKSGELVLADPGSVHEVVRALWDFLDGGAPVGTVDYAARAEAAVDADTIEPEPEPTPGATPAPPPKRQPTPPTPKAWSTKALRAIDRALGKLRRDGWTVLSPGGRRIGADFDRLVIGPPGVFAMTIRPAREASPVTPGPGACVRAHARGHEAASVTRMLSAGTGMTVKVRTLIVLAGTDGEATGGEPDGFRICEFTDGGGEPCDVLAVPGARVAEVLWSLPSVYSVQERHRIRDVARRADLWRAA